MRLNHCCAMPSSDDNGLCPLLLRLRLTFSIVMIFSFPILAQSLVAYCSGIISQIRCPALNAILCPPGEESLEPFVYKADLPARLPPAVNIDDLGGPSPLPSSFDKPLHDKNLEDQLCENPFDLDPLPLDSTHPTHRHDSGNDRSRGSTDLSPTDDNPQKRDDDEFDDDVLVEYSHLMLNHLFFLIVHSPFFIFRPRIHLVMSH